MTDGWALISGRTGFICVPWTFRFTRSAVVNFTCYCIHCRHSHPASCFAPAEYPRLIIYRKLTGIHCGNSHIPSCSRRSETIIIVNLSYPHNYEVFPSTFRSRRRFALGPDLRPILKFVRKDGDRPDLELLLIPLCTGAPRREPHEHRHKRVSAIQRYNH